MTVEDQIQVLMDYKAGKITDRQAIFLIGYVKDIDKELAQIERERAHSNPTFAQMPDSDHGEDHDI
jgi:uncharacterized FlgJ-related protein